MFLRFHRIWALSLAILISAFVSASSAWAVDATVTKTQDAVEGSTNGQFTITLDDNSSSPTTISFDISGSAVVGEDYNTPVDNVTIPANTTVATVIIQLIDGLYTLG